MIGTGKLAFFVVSVCCASSLAALAAPKSAAELTISCESQPGDRNYCVANTSAGVVLVKSFGSAPCLLGKTWGYDDGGIWVSDGCSGNFYAGEKLPKEGVVPEEAAKKPRYIPNRGFLLFDGDEGEMYVRLMTYVRYLNQLDLDPTWTSFFGTTSAIQKRQDVQLNKFFLPFSGWFLDPRFRYYLYVWSANPSQGDPAQVVGAGNITFNFNRFVSLGGGISSLPSTRSTEGQFPYWLGVDDRLIADEFFRGSYTTGIWLKGQLATGVSYMAMLGNNLSTLGVSASQLDNGLNTQSYSVVWTPTTKEFGLNGTFGDYDWHQNVATRLGVHYTHSREDEQSQAGANSIENSQLRLTDGSNLFTADLFGPGINIRRATYGMTSVDAGVKYKGMSAEAEYYWRTLSNFSGDNVGGIADIDDHGFQLQISGMAVKDVLQVYAGRSEIAGIYGDAAETRAGGNWYPLKKRGLRVNAEWIHLNHCPVGYTAVPYPVGGNGDVYHLNAEMNF